jgi:ParB-like chromosome segregation protein Spo0J
MEHQLMTLVAKITIPEQRQKQDLMQTILAALDSREPETLPIRLLLPADSPRLNGEDAQHSRLLSELDTSLPPILVNRRSMRVIDGMHRLKAAALNGQDEIGVRFFDGNDDDSFVASVVANISHGLPLTLADREAAALRILRSHPHWSDRAVAGATGLAGKTVGGLRKRAANKISAVDFRIGRDGRARPLNASEGRRLAQQIIEERPHASLREIARAAGISPNTVRSVREGMRRQGDARAHGAGDGDQGGPNPSARARPVTDRASLLERLRKDPALRYSESGRALLRWLYERASNPRDGLTLMQGIPPHCSYAVSQLARACAQEWLDLAKELDQQAGMTA